MKADWLRGLWASVPTPLQPNGDLHLEGIPSLVDHYVDVLALEGIYCNGIMGEGWLLTHDERKAVLTALSIAAKARLKIGVVVTAGSPTETVELAAHAEQVGVHHIVVAPPPGHFSSAELIAYVQMIREAVALPLVIVQTSSGGFGLDIVRELASVDGLVSAIKLGANGEDLQTMINEFGSRISVTDPLEVNWLTNLEAVGMQVLYADPEPYLFQTANHRPIDGYYRSFVAGDLSGAARISSQLEPVREVYDRWIMRPLISGVAPIGALKAWCEYMGLSVGPPRQPLSPLTSRERQQLYGELRAIGCAPSARSAPAQAIRTE